jgi:hypothetical protein
LLVITTPQYFIEGLPWKKGGSGNFKRQQGETTRHFGVDWHAKEEQEVVVKKKELHSVSKWRSDRCPPPVIAWYPVF